MFCLKRLDALIKRLGVWDRLFNKKENDYN